MDTTTSRHNHLTRISGRYLAPVQFTDSGDTFTVTCDVPIALDNIPLKMMWGIIGQNLDTVVSFTSTPGEW